MNQRSTKTIEELEKELNELALKYKSKFGHEIPFGAFIFEDIIKPSCENEQNPNVTLANYRKELRFWVNESLTNSSIIGEAEVAKRIVPLIQNEINFLEKDNSTSIQITQTKTDILKAELDKFGFFKLPKTNLLSEPSQKRLFELIMNNDLPYRIAMFEHVGFRKYLKNEHFTTDYKLFQAVADWFQVSPRAVKGNFNVLNDSSKENRTRYTADQQKENVKKEYEKLK